MTFTENQIKQVESMASLYMKISDIAAILDVPESDLRVEINSFHSHAGKAYRKAKAESKLKLYEQEMMLASVGSPVALENCKHNLIEMEEDE